MWSPVFKIGDKIRKPVQFHSGLNVVMGMENADNSIGKSSSLLAIDFIFGGDSYLKSVAVRKIGDHPIFFCFQFDKKYYFSRNTDNSDLITVCDNNYQPTETTYKLEEYIEFLQEKYRLDNTGLSFRLGVSGFFRIAGKSNHDPDWPLRVYTGQSSAASIITLIQLFDLYDDIEVYKNRLTEKSEKLKTFKNARKYNFISNLIGGKEKFEENVSKIKELEYELLQLKDTHQENINTEDIERSKEKVSLKNYRLELEKALMDKQRKLTLVDISLDYGLYPTEADLSSLQEFFPDVNIKKIYEVEKYHKKLATILDSEFSNEREEIKSDIKKLEAELEVIREKMNQIGASTNLSSDFLEKYSELISTINALKEQNQAYIDERELSKEKSNADNDLKRSIEDILVELQEKINGKMREFNDILYPDIRKSPQITLKAHNSYSFHTPDDDGTGTKYKGMLVFDLAILYMTNLPALAHDSLLFKNISDQAIAGLTLLYEQSEKLGKQIFMAIDKPTSYKVETAKILKDNTVLQLSDNGNELYGVSWSKGANKDEY